MGGVLSGYDIPLKVARNVISWIMRLICTDLNACKIWIYTDRFYAFFFKSTFIPNKMFLKL